MSLEHFPRRVLGTDVSFIKLTWNVSNDEKPLLRGCSKSEHRVPDNGVKTKESNML